MRFAAAPEYQVFPTRERALKPYEAAVRAAAETREADPRRSTPRWWWPTSSRSPPRWRPSSRTGPGSTLVPHVLPMGEPGFPVYAVGAV